MRARSSRAKNETIVITPFRYLLFVWPNTISCMSASVSIDTNEVYINSQTDGYFFRYSIAQVPTVICLIFVTDEVHEKRHVNG